MIEAVANAPIKQVSNDVTSVLAQNAATAKPHPTSASLFYYNILRFISHASTWSVTHKRCILYNGAPYVCINNECWRDNYVQFLPSTTNYAQQLCDRNRI